MNVQSIPHRFAVLCGVNVFVDLGDVHQIDGVENWCHVRCSLQGIGQLFLIKDRLEVVRIDLAIIAIPLFRVDVPSSSQCIRLSTKLTGMEANGKIEGSKEFRPVSLVVGEDLSGGEVF